MPPLEPTSTTRRYRGHLDGLRAVSLLFVVAQHITTTTRWYAGATGVAVFFALSGYLISGLILDELDTRGGFLLSRFYLRRGARLVPGLAVMLIGGGCILVAVGVGSYTSDIVPSFLYLNNYASILAGGRHLNLAFGHTWSLAVEEHFYLLWPVVVVGACRRWGLRGLLVLTLFLCLAALTYRGILAATVKPSPEFFYFDSLSRADSILYGSAACVAVRLGWRPRTWQLLAGLAGLGGYLAANSVLIGGLLGSAVSGLACAVLVAAVDRGEGQGWLRRTLSSRWLRFVGERSYSIYLWHLPLIAAAIAVAALDRPGVRMIGVLASLGFAFASYRWVETPLRDAVRRFTAGNDRDSSPTDRHPGAGAHDLMGLGAQNRTASAVRRSAELVDNRVPEAKPTVSVAGQSGGEMVVSGFTGQPTTPVRHGNPDTLVIVPMYNESAAVASTISDLLREFDRVVCVDDGSRDGSAEVAVAAGALVLRHPANLGQGAALQTGIAFGLRTEARYFITFDADGQHQVADALSMLARARQSDVDVVLGSRFSRSTSIPALRRRVLQGAVLFTRLTTGLRLTDAHNGLRVMNRRTAGLLDLRMHGMAHASELLATVARHRLRYVEVPMTVMYSDYSRAKGQSSLNAVNIVIDLLLGRARYAR